MIRAPRYTQELSECRDTSLVGGKAAILGRLIREGFPVPGGFLVTTQAWEARDGQGGRHGRCGQGGQDGAGTASTESTSSTYAESMPPAVAEDIQAAYRALGSPVVAVRSSGTAEDTAAASMAGQYETFLDIQGEQALLDAVRRCWASLDAPRVQAYLREHEIDPSGVAMAVVVQRQVPADAAGVLFTTNPHDGRHREMLIEASWGLGETVVSGRVQPDVLRVERDTGRVLEAAIADKQVYLAAGARVACLVEESRRRQPCLRGRDVDRLWQLERRVAGHFGRPMDIEWAISGGEPYVLQSRPITTLADSEAYEDVLRTAQAHLRQELTQGREPWVLHNLAETLPHPTPLTWSIMKRFMSGSGGFGTMYRQAGFEPSPVADRDGFLERIAGRIYMDAARAPEMLFENFPFAYDLEQLRRSPDASQTPPTLPCGSSLSRWRAGRKLAAVQARLNTLSTSFERELRQHLFDEIAAFTAGAKQIDLGSFSVHRLLELWEGRERRILDVFEPRLLMPGLVAATAMGELRTFLQETLWDEDADAVAQLISAGGPPNRTVMANAELYEVARGNRSLETWLTDHGHRAAGEQDLAEPRWRERPAAVREMADRLATGEGPLDRHRRNAEEIDRQVAAIRSRLTGAQRREFDRRVSLVRRLEIGQDVFYLTRDELFDSLRVGFAPYHLIEQRKIGYRAEARLSLPRMIDAQALGTLGETPDVKPSAGGHKAFAVSSGEAAGPARILHSPTEAGDLGRGYILICPSTDPSWTPLFVNAAGLVLECGGTLSHGAIVAREMGLPAVVLPDATKLSRDGEEIRVDGRRGWVSPAGEVQDGRCGRHGHHGQGGAGTASALSTESTSSIYAESVLALAMPPATEADDASIPRDLIPPPVAVDDSTGLSRTLPPIRKTLEHLLALYRQPRDDPAEPWELTLAPDSSREQTANDLQAYLDTGIPPQGITWLLRPPDTMSGRFPVTVTAGEHPPVSVSVVLGDDVPPAPCRVIGPADSPVKELRVVYPKSKHEPVFWRPLARLGGRMAAIDIG